MGRYVVSKWKKTKALEKYDDLKKVIPDTVQMTKSSLHHYLREYNMVYIKPDYGTYGNGVMRVKKTKNGYRYQLGEKVRHFSSYTSMYQSILRQTRGKRYLAQRGIHLLQHDGRSFDLRVMVQLSPAKTWETTGIIGRVAAPRKIVTNYHSGGTIIAAEKLLGPHTKNIKSQLHFLDKLGVQVGNAMGKNFPGVSALGLDVAMDESMTPWILEVNTSPDPYIFRKLPDKSIFRKIRRYSKLYRK